MNQVRKLNENSNRRYQFYDRRIKNLLRKIHTDSREKPTKNNSDVSCFKQMHHFLIKNKQYNKKRPEILDQYKKKIY